MFKSTEYINTSTSIDTSTEYIVLFTETSTEYIGCYLDNSMDLDLPLWMDFKAHLTISTCQKACGALYYGYAGVQASSHCYCGDTYGKHGQQGESTCDTPCTGNTSQTCGGSTYNAIYRSTPNFILGN